MPIAIWSRHFETGIDLVDAQHQSLFKAVNQLVDLFRTGGAKDQVKESLDRLVGFALEHFQTEERFMRAADYPRLAEHIVEHARLLEQVRDLQMDLADGKAVTPDVTRFLVDWLKAHIHGSDMAYATFMRELHQK